MKNSTITFSAPAKLHLLGEHAVVYGKPAILAAINLRVAVILNSLSSVIASDRRERGNDKIKAIIEPIVKKNFKLKIIPPYNLKISSQFPLGVGLGSSAAISSAYIAALLSFLKIKWDLNLINNLSYEAEKVFHSNPSGGDNSTVVYGGLIWFRKETPDLKIIQLLDFAISTKLTKNFILINTGAPKESTGDMVRMISARFKAKSSKFRKLLDDQETLVKQLLSVIKDGKEDEFIKIIRAGEKNLETIGVVSSYVASIIRKIEKIGGAAKICGGGGKTKATGILLAYHHNRIKIEEIAKSFKLPYFCVSLGAKGLTQES